VASLSLGGGDTTTLREACAYAHDRGVLLVAAAGNGGPCTGCLDAPAWYDETVAVSATRRDDSLASFSSAGRGVDLAAPGDGVYSTDVGGAYTTRSGTSMACPHVSGAAAQLLARGLTNDEARQRLQATAEDVGLGRDESGAGLLDVAAALGVDSRDDR
jgi:subtilisin